MTVRCDTTCCNTHKYYITQHHIRYEKIKTDCFWWALPDHGFVQQGRDCKGEKKGKQQHNSISADGGKETAIVIGILNVLEASIKVAFLLDILKYGWLETWILFLQLLMSGR